MIAIIALLVALQAAPELKQHVDAGLKAKSAGDLDTAIREFQRVVELAPGMAAAWNSRPGSAPGRRAAPPRRSH